MPLKSYGALIREKGSSRTHMTPEELTIAVVEWKNNLTTNIIWFAIITLLFLAVLIVFFVIGFMREVSENWSRYRCKPFVMPFADLYGYDSTENINFCLQTFFKSQSSEAFGPIYDLLAKYTSAMGLMVNSVNGYRKLLGNTMTASNVFIRRVRDRVQSLLFQIRMSFLKLQVLMNRVYGTMYSVVWMGSSAITAGLNLADNDLIQFMFEFCFVPNTLLRLADGSAKEIQFVEVGDMLEGGVRVTSTFVFDGAKTPMVQIGEDILSSQHFVQLPSGSWRPAFHHPDAVSAASVPRLCCLNVERHRFRTAAGLVVADYDESSDPEVIQAAQCLAATALNGGTTCIPASDATSYTLGFDPDAEIHMGDDTWKSVRTLKLGDVLAGGNTVLGIVDEACDRVYVAHDIVRLAPAQLVFQEELGIWRRASNMYSPPEATGEEPMVLRQIVTAHAGPLCIRKKGVEMWVRDYREAPLPEMEDAYEAHLQK